MEELGEEQGGEYNQNTSYKILKELVKNYIIKITNIKIMDADPCIHTGLKE